MKSGADKKCAFPECNVTKTKTCSRCKLVRYCSVDHQKQHYKVHKPWCIKNVIIDAKPMSVHEVSAFESDVGPTLLKIAMEHLQVYLEQGKTYLFSLDNEIYYLNYPELSKRLAAMMPAKVLSPMKLPIIQCGNDWVNGKHVAVVYMTTDKLQMYCDLITI